MKYVRPSRRLQIKQQPPRRATACQDSGPPDCQTPEEFKACSQNFGHDGVMTTFVSYGEVQESRQSEIFAAFKVPRKVVANPDVGELAKALAQEMRVLKDD